MRISDWSSDVCSADLLWRDIALILIAPLLLYLLASLLSFSPSDPGWSHSGSLTAPLHNVGGRVGAWLADVLLHLTGYVAYLLPVMLGAIAWIALFGMDTDGDRSAERRVGKECVSTCRSRWSPYPSKKKNTKKKYT